MSDDTSMGTRKSAAPAHAEGQIRRITFEIPAEVSLSEEDIAGITAEISSQLIDTRSEEVLVKAKPTEKQVPAIVQVKEVAVPKSKAQSA